MDRTSERIAQPGVAGRLLTVLLTIVLLAAIAPGGAAGGFWHRALLFGLCTLIWEAGIMLVMQMMRWRFGRGCFGERPALLAVAILLASLPVTLAMALVIRLATGHGVQLQELFEQSLLLALLIGFARRGLFRTRTSNSTQTDEMPVDVLAVATDQPLVAGRALRDFMIRHAPQLAAGRLLALEAEDHYLRIHAERGSTLVLMRLSDAIVSLGADAGRRVHRSFWVAADAPARAERRGQGWQLVLENGLTVPVSRSGAKTLGAAWLEAQAPASFSATGSTAE